MKQIMVIFSFCFRSSEFLQNKELPQLIGDPFNDIEFVTLSHIRAAVAQLV
jgi:hypothetical protein